jgi:Na+-transporting NADH:ubiquinone oxidoreductase subunit NqrB
MIAVLLSYPYICCISNLTLSISFIFVQPVAATHRNRKKWSLMRMCGYTTLNLSINVPPFMETEGLLPPSKQLTTVPCLESDESSPRPLHCFLRFLSI